MFDIGTKKNVPNIQIYPQDLVEEKDDICIIVDGRSNSEVEIGDDGEMMKHGLKKEAVNYNDNADSCRVSYRQNISSIHMTKDPKVIKDEPIDSYDYNKFLMNKPNRKKGTKIHSKSKKLMKKSLLCSKCGDPFSNMSSVKRHQKSCGKESLRKKMVCFHPTCKRRYHKMIELLHHIQREHEDLKVETSEHTFKNTQEFNNWKATEEVTTHAKYTRQGGKTKTISGTHYSYVCQNSGTDRGKRLTSRKHKKGKVKTGVVCPARMLVQESIKGGINIRYIKTHNHSMSIENTQYQILPKSIIDFITSQLALGVSEKIIHNDLVTGIKDQSIFELDGQPVIRKQIVTERYIKQLGIKNNITAQLSKKDAEALDILVHNLNASQYCPILTYKPQHRSCIIGAVELDHLPFSEDLFALGLQTKEQLDILKKYRSRILSVDTTHSRKPYDFDLFSIIIPDEYGKGYPIAYFITNYRDEISLRYLFSSLKQCFSEYDIEAVITDDSLRGLNSYKALSFVFGKAEHILCNTHIKRNWKFRLKSMIKGNTRLQHKIQGYLEELLQETNIERFKSLCKDLANNYGSLTFISEYLCKKYFNRTELWAKCYRANLHINNTDSIPNCRILNEKLKAYFNSQTPDRRVSDLVPLLLNFWCNNSIEGSSYSKQFHQMENKYQETEASNINIQNLTPHLEKLNRYIQDPRCSQEWLQEIFNNVDMWVKQYESISQTGLNENESAVRNIMDKNG